MVPEIILALLGRVPRHRDASLSAYARFLVRGASYPGIVPALESSVEGTLYEGLFDAEWQLLDEYEGDLYERRNVVVTVGTQAIEAFSYVVRPQRVDELTERAWDLQWYLREHGPVVPVD